MPKGKQKSTDALRRQWTLVRRIPPHPRKRTAAQLTQELASDGFKVTKRTVERDLVALSEVFTTIECDDRDATFGWSWARDAVPLHLPGLTNSQALAFQMIERFIKPLLPASTVESLQPYLRASGEKLSEVSPASSWTKKVRVVHPTQLLIPPKINPAVHRAVTEGLLLDRQMEVVYRKRGRSETVTHIVNPLGLVQRGPVTYFVVNQSKDPFYLALHRISSAGLLDAPAQRPPNFDLDELIASGRFGFGDGTKIKLQALFDNRTAEHLHESPISTDQVLSADGDRTRLVAAVPHNQQLEWWLLGFGEQVEVLSPAKLRANIRRSSTQMARSYRR